MYNFKNLINGKLIDKKNKLKIISPINLKPIGEVNQFDTEEIDEVFAYANKAFKKWSNTKLETRINYLKEFNKLLVKNIDYIAEIICQEIAKTHDSAVSEVKRTIEYIKYTIEEARRLNPISYSGDAWGIDNKIGIFKRVATGVILAISPFNYPINLLMSKLAAALVTGNTVVYKPATNGSLIGTYVSELFAQINIPPGVVNVITGRGSKIGDKLVSNPNISLINFTGSIEIGTRIKKLVNGAKLILELGGKDPMIVLEDGDINKAANDIIAGGFGYSGQRCTAIKLVLVNDKIADNLINKVKTLTEKLTVGSPENNCFITPLLNNANANYVKSLIDDALAHNAKLIIGNKQINNLIYPTILDHVTPQMDVAKYEPFGPVIPFVRCNNTKEMIKIANNLEYGLQASIYTININSAFNIADQLEVGTVNINSKSQRGPDSFPFLGIKKSGVGAQGIHESLIAVTRLKGTVINY